MFSEKLGSFEAKVNPELWANLASQVGAASSTAATGGMSLLTKAIIGISGAAVVTTAVVLYTSTDSETLEPKTKETAVALDSPSQEKANETLKQDPKTFVVENNTSNENGQNNIESPVVPVNPAVDPDQYNAQNIDPDVTPQRLNIEDPALVNNPPKPDPIVSTTDPVIQANPSIFQNTFPILPEENVTKEDEPIRVNKPIELVESPETRPDIRVVMPNIFTPNGDRRNDDYFMKSSNVTFNSFEFIVYNSRREEVYKTTDPDFIWDGRDQRSGEYIQLDNGRGLFVYFITATTEDGRGFTASDVITIQQ